MGVGRSSEKWTEDPLVSVGEGGVRAEDQEGVGEPWRSGACELGDPPWPR